MGKTCYVKISEGGQRAYYTTAQFRQFPDVLAILNDAVDAKDKGMPITGYILAHSGSCVSITAREWEQMTKEQTSSSEDARFVEIDLDRSFARISEWHNGSQTTISGDITRLTGCYALSIKNGKLDTDQLLTKLIHHCNVQMPTASIAPASVDMVM